MAESCKDHIPRRTSWVAGLGWSNTSSLCVGGAEASADKDAAAREQDKRGRHEWWVRSCSDTCNLARGVAKKSGERFDWNKCNRECLADEPIQLD